MNNLNNLTDGKLRILINSFIKLYNNNEICIDDIENLCKFVYFNGLNKGKETGYDIGYRDCLEKEYNEEY